MQAMQTIVDAQLKLEHAVATLDSAYDQLKTRPDSLLKEIK
jgi:hypothetical protein